MDPHWFHADADPVFFYLSADPDPGSETNGNPDPDPGHKKFNFYMNNIGS